ncbi:MAG: hypothetical protein ACRC42_02465, partial [Mycoplasma sp.]
IILKQISVPAEKILETDVAIENDRSKAELLDAIKLVQRQNVIFQWKHKRRNCPTRNTKSGIPQS